MFKWLKREKISTIYVCAGDKVELSHEKEGKKTKVLSADITRNMKLDEAAVFEFKDEFDMKEGVGGVFGKSTDS